jgi:hypothetical protein
MGDFLNSLILFRNQFWSPCFRASYNGHNGAEWRQIFIFPEGTTTNGKTLIKFKTGAFQVTSWGPQAPREDINPLGRNWPSEVKLAPGEMLTPWGEIGPQRLS